MKYKSWKSTKITTRHKKNHVPNKKVHKFKVDTYYTLKLSNQHLYVEC